MSFQELEEAISERSGCTSSAGDNLSKWFWLSGEDDNRTSSWKRIRAGSWQMSKVGRLRS